MQVSGGEYVDANLGIVYREEVCLISLGSQLLPDRRKELGRVGAPGDKTAPGA